MRTRCNTAHWLGLLVILLGCSSNSHAADSLPERAADNAHTTVYIGTYATAQEVGIHVYLLDMQTGTLARVGGIRGIKNPSFQAIHPSKRFLYSVSESQDFQGKRTGSVSSFAIDKDTGMLKLLNKQSSLGGGPCHLITDHAGENVLVANYGSGSLAVLPIRKDGSLDIAHNPIQHVGSSVHPSRQTAPHAHCITNDAHDRYTISADLGLDKVFIYRYSSATHSLTPNSQMPFAQVAPGSGPRHFTFHPSERFGYVINELNSTITAFTYDGERGTLSQIQNVSTLPDKFKGPNSTAEIVLSPDGRFLYGSNRGHDSIAVFAVDSETGMLTFVSHYSTQGEQPRNFAIDPTGSFLLVANQNGGNVVEFRIDRHTGQLRATGVKVHLNKAVCVTFLRQ